MRPTCFHLLLVVYVILSASSVNEAIYWSFASTYFWSFSSFYRRVPWTKRSSCGTRRGRACPARTARRCPFVRKAKARRRIWWLCWKIRPRFPSCSFLARSNPRCTLVKGNVKSSLYSGLGNCQILVVLWLEELSNPRCTLVKGIVKGIDKEINQTSAAHGASRAEQAKEWPP